ncbi:hypothetical protein A7K93_05345, partial [Candidatus Methylacidiphilum fumarolicum]
DSEGDCAMLSLSFGQSSAGGPNGCSIADLPKSVWKAPSLTAGFRYRLLTLRPISAPNFFGE